MTRHGPIVMYFSGLNTQMHHSWEHLGILSPWDIVPMGFCPPGFLSSWDFVRLDIVLWVFVQWDFVLEPLPSHVCLGGAGCQCKGLQVQSVV